MTHRLGGSSEEINDPREALAYEFSRAPEIEKKLTESNRRGSLVRATRIENGLDLLFRKALEANKQ
jgi:hypothetical protein